MTTMAESLEWLKDPEIMKGYYCYHESFKKFALPVAELVPGAISTLQEPTPMEFLYVVGTELNKRAKRIKELEALVDMLSQD